MSDPLVTVIEISTLCNIDLSADYPSGYMSGVINVVSEHIRAYCLGTLFEPTEIDAERSESYVRGKTGMLKIRLKFAPLISVGGVRYRSGSTETTIPIDDADMDRVNAYINLICARPDWHITIPIITVTDYMAGFTSIPEEVRMAAAQLVLEWTAADDAAAGGDGWVVSRYQIANYSESYSVGEALIGNLGLGSNRSIRAAQLLRKYRRPGVK